MSSRLVVAATPSGAPPMISPTSRPFFASEYTKQPTRSRSGCSRTPLIAATPTDPVAHCTTRRLIASPSCASATCLDHPVDVLSVTGPDDLLVVLADAGARQLLDEGPPFR